MTMGADGRFKLIKIGRGQHLLPEDAIRFTVAEGEPVAVIYLYPIEFGKHWNLTSMNDALDGMIESDLGPLPCSPIYGTAGDEQNALVAGVTVQLVSELKLARAMVVGDCAWDSINHDTDPATTIEAWAKITPGLWVLSEYTAYGVDGYYSLHLPHDKRDEIEILDTVEFECWT